MCSIEWCHFRWPWGTPNPSFRSHYSVKANISQTVHPIHSVFGSRLGFRGRRIEWRYLRFDKIQDGGWRPSWNNGAVARNPCVSWAFLLQFLYVTHSLLCNVFRVTEDKTGQAVSANRSSVQWDARESGVSNSTRLTAGRRQPEGTSLWADGQGRVPWHLAASSHSQGFQQVLQENPWLWQIVSSKSRNTGKCHGWTSLCLSVLIVILFQKASESLDS